MRPAGSFGRKAPNFSARYSRMAPDSKTRIGVGPAAVEQRRDLRVRVDADEAAAELVALVDLDQPGVVLGAGVARREQLLEHDP